MDPPPGARKISVSERAFLGVICRDDTKTVCRTSDHRNVNLRPHLQGKSPLCAGQKTIHSVNLMVSCRLSSCKPECTMEVCEENKESQYVPVIDFGQYQNVLSCKHI